ncbi:hypothetical protein OAS86_06870, partial [Gammaproteobacteria bacterium]|nr:hypothetical protein [Gammaproteobacteria bacterium]
MASSKNKNPQRQAKKDAENAPQQAQAVSTSSAHQNTLSSASGGDVFYTPYQFINANSNKAKSTLEWKPENNDSFR